MPSLERGVSLSPPRGEFRCLKRTPILCGDYALNHKEKYEIRYYLGESRREKKIECARESDKEDRTIAPRCVAVALCCVSAIRFFFFGLKGGNRPPSLLSLMALENKKKNR